jgi:serine/threonine protein kinase
MHLRCPHCQNPIEIVDVPSATEISCPGCGSSFIFDPYATSSQAPPAQRIGKFEILTLLGEGNFGSVLKARDTELDRIVAIKVPRIGNVGSGPQDVDDAAAASPAACRSRCPTGARSCRSLR